jgi:hypothetical protein
MAMSEYEDCFVFACNGCGLTAEFERGGPGTFMACVGEIKSRGWRIVRAGDDWEHFCSDRDCRAAVAKKAVEGAKRLLDQPFRSVK